ncbi:hypothetical protein KR018_006557, partial [Drosophila ironensis]
SIDHSAQGDELPLEKQLAQLSLRDFRNEHRMEPPPQDLHLDLHLPKQKDVVDTMMEFWRLKGHCDYTVRIGAHQFPCHRMVLMVYIDWVREHPEKSELELPEDVVPAGIFPSLYHWMTDQETQLKRSEIIDLLSAAQYLRIKDLTHQIWSCLESKDFIEHHAFQVAKEVLRFKDLQHLHLPMLQRISCYFLTFVSTVEFLALSLDSLVHLFSSCEIAVNSEAEVFYAAIRWLNHNWPQRVEHVMKVMENVRLIRMSKKLVRLLQEQRGECQVDRVTQLPDMQRKLEEISFNQCLMRQSDGTTFFVQIYEIFGVTLPPNRKFICHGLSAYHQPAESAASSVFSYGDFLSYLGVL